MKLNKKKCGRCQIFQYLTEFHKNKAKKDGLSTECKKCSKQLHIINKEKNNLISLNYYYKNKEILRLKRINYGKVYRENNKEKIAKRDKRYFSKNKVKVNKIRFKHHLKRKYGLTIEDHTNLKINQDYRCLICKRHQDELNKSLCVDHCHKSGKIRGLLCDRCNKMIGYAKDSIIILEEAINYLKSNEIK